MRNPLIHRSQTEREAILDIVERYLAMEPRVVFAYVHGSLLENRPLHDIDLAVYLDPGGPGDMTTRALELASRLERALPLELHLPVDVRVLNEAPLGFRFHALRGKLLFCRDDDLRTRLVEHTASRYLDLKPLLQQALREAMKAWA